MELHNGRAWKQITFSLKPGKRLNLGHNLNGKFFHASRLNPNGNCRWVLRDFEAFIKSKLVLVGKIHKMEICDDKNTP